MREMKDSGIEWIGEIPKEWEKAKLKHFVKIYSGEMISKEEYVDNGDFPIIGSNGEIGRTNKYNNEEKVITTGRVGTIGTIHIVKKSWITDNALIVKSNNINQKYLSYIIVNFDFKHMLSGTAQPLITSTNLKNQYITLPPLAEQQKISAYLDTKCTKIDSIIEKQEKVIEKLKEYKLSVITEAVTKGLNPDVKMKDSGVEWIGEIPDECKVTRAGHIFNIILGKMLSPTPKQDDDTFEKYLCAANVHFTGISYEPLKQMWFSKTEKKLYAVHLGDLLVVEGGAGAGGAAIVEKKLGNCYIQNSIMIVRSKENTSNKWLYYTLYSIVKRNYVDFVCNKATIPHFTKDKLGNVPVVKFKKENETEIINYLDKKCSAIDKSIEQKQAIIEKLKEYKKSLIYEVVTGKRGV